MFKLYRFILMLLILLMSVIPSNIYGDDYEMANLFTTLNTHESILYLIHTLTDQIISIPLTQLEGWPGGQPQHSWVTPDGRTVYISTDASETNPAYIVILNVKTNWGQQTASADIIKVLTLDPAGAT